MDSLQIIEKFVSALTYIINYTDYFQFSEE